MKKFEDLLNKRNLEIEAQKKARDERIRELNSEKFESTKRLIGSIVISIIGFYFGIIKWDGGLFTGFFMQILFVIGVIASIVSLVLLIIAFTKDVDDKK
jgi:hypothetical protein